MEWSVALFQAAICRRLPKSLGGDEGQGCESTGLAGSIFVLPKPSTSDTRLSQFGMHTLYNQPGEAHADCVTRFPPAMPRHAVKWNELPLPSSLSTQIRPPNISVSLREIVSPRPVPPYLRVVELSAWV